MNDKYELIKFEDGEFSIDVSVDPTKDTVWLTQKEIELLFNVSHSTISEHISNIFRDGEISKNNSVGISDKNGKGRKAVLYNLDIILAIGYRVNSKRGILFRKWATSILKQYMMQGYAINEKRCIECSSNIISLQNKVNKLENDIKDLKGSDEKLIYEGDLIEPYTFIRKLFFLAKKELIIIDNYADKFLLDMLKGVTVSITLIGAKYLNNIDAPNIKIIHDNTFHDLFIITDDTIYLIGTSLNNLGKKKFMIIKLDDINKKMLLDNIYSS